VRLPRNSISYAPDRVDVPYAFRPNAWTVLTAGLTVAGRVVAGSFVVAGIAIAIVPVLLLVSRLGLRLTADREGLRILNYGASSRFAWSEIVDMRVVRRWWGAQLEIRDRRRRRAVPFVTRSSNLNGYGEDQLARLVSRLELLRREAVGAADPPGLAFALDAARSGDPGPIDALLSTHAIDETLYTGRLHELAEAGEVDLETLRAVRRRELDLPANGAWLQALPQPLRGCYAAGPTGFALLGRWRRPACRSR
jgi:hypothetical protein